MVVIYSNMSVVTTNVHGLTLLLKDQGYHIELKRKAKQKPETYLLHKDPKVKSESMTKDTPDIF